MRIDEEKCRGCGSCVKFCSARAISMGENRKARIDEEKCFECGNCRLGGACKFDAIYQNELAWPRVVRSIMSNPTTVTNGMGGRGTEEMKTNDVTGRFKKGVTGICIEMGRPVTGTTFRDMEYMAKVLISCGCEFEEKNPITGYMKDSRSGDFREEVLDERILSGILEVVTPIERLVPTVRTIIAESENIGTVFSLAVCCKLERDGGNPAARLLRDAGIFVRQNGKTNVGLGKPKFIFEE